MNKLRLAALAAAAFGFYAFTGNHHLETSTLLDDEYTIVDPSHLLFGDTLTSQQIVNGNLCPNAGRDCAEPTSGNKEIIEWEGPTVKF